MTDIMQIREKVIRFYKQYDTAINLCLKFIMGFIIFHILGSIQAQHPKVMSILGQSSLIITLFLAIIFMVLPPTLGNLLLVIYLSIQLSSSPAFAGLIFLLGIVVLLLYGRMAPKESYLIVGIIIGFYLKMPFMVVLFAGLYMGLTSIIPISIGTFIWNLGPAMKEMLQNIDPLEMVKEGEVLSLVNQTASVFKVFFATLVGDFKWVFVAFIFAMMVVAVYIISRLSVNYAKEISLIVGGIIGLFGMMVAVWVMKMPLSILGIIVSSVISTIIMLGLSLFDMSLEYTETERLQFQDEHFYYHVRVIPKIGSERPAFIEKENKEMTTGIRRRAIENPRGRREESNLDDTMIRPTHTERSEMEARNMSLARRKEIDRQRDREATRPSDSGATIGDTFQLDRDIKKTNDDNWK